MFYFLKNTWSQNFIKSFYLCLKYVPLSFKRHTCKLRGNTWYVLNKIKASILSYIVKSSLNIRRVTMLGIAWKRHVLEICWWRIPIPLLVTSGGKGNATWKLYWGWQHGSRLKWREGLGPSRSYNYLEVVRLAHTNSQAFIAEIVV